MLHIGIDIEEFAVYNYQPVLVAITGIYLFMFFIIDLNEKCKKCSLQERKKFNVFCLLKT